MGDFIWFFELILWMWLPMVWLPKPILWMWLSTVQVRERILWMWPAFTRKSELFFWITSGFVLFLGQDVSVPGANVRVAPRGASPTAVGLARAAGMSTGAVRRCCILGRTQRAW